MFSPIYPHFLALLFYFTFMLTQFNPKVKSKKRQRVVEVKHMESLVWSLISHIVTCTKVDINKKKAQNELIYVEEFSIPRNATASI